MSDVLASLSIKVETPGFTAAMGQLDKLAGLGQRVQNEAELMNMALRNLAGGVKAFTDATQTVQAAGKALQAAMQEARAPKTDGASDAMVKSFDKQIKAMEQAANKQKKLEDDLQNARMKALPKYEADMARVAGAEYKAMVAKLDRQLAAMKVSETKQVKSAQDVTAAQIREWDKQVKAMELAMAKEAKVAATAAEKAIQLAKKQAADRAKARDGGGSSDLHSFISASSSGMHVGLLGAMPPQVAAVAMAAGMALGPIKAFFGSIVDGVEASLQASMKMDQVRAAMHVVATSQEDMDKHMEFVTKTAERLALPLQETAMAYAKLGAAAGDDTKAQEAAKQSFLGVATAARAMHLSTGNVSGAIKALTDIFSKNQVMTEEVKKQLGNQIPGAMKIAASAAKDMGLTLDHALKMGLLKGDKMLDFVLRFGIKLQEGFGSAAEVAASNLNAQLVRMETGFMQLGDAVADVGIKGGAALAIKGIADGVKTITAALKEMAKSDAGKALAAAFKTVGEAIGETAKYFAGWIADFLKDKDNLEMISRLLLGVAINIAQTGMTAKIAAVDLQLLYHAHNLLAKFFLGNVQGVEKEIEALKSLRKERKAIVDQSITAAQNVTNSFFKHLNAPPEKSSFHPSSGKTPPASDKEDPLVKRQNKFIESLDNEIEVNDILAEKLDKVKGLYKSLLDMKLAYVGVDDKIHPTGASGVYAIARVEARDEQLQVKKQNEEIKKAEESQLANQIKLRDSIGAKLTLEEMFPTVQKETLKIYDAMVANHGMILNLTTGEWETIGKVAEETKRLADLEDKRLAGKKAMTEEDKRMKHIQNTYGRGAQTDQAKQDWDDIQTFRRNRMGGGMMTAEDLATYSKMMDAYRMKTDETYKAVSETIDRAMGVVENSMMDFVTKGVTSWAQFRDGFKKMVGDILAEIARMIIRMTILKPIMDAFKNDNGSGSFMSLISGLFGGGGGEGGVEISGNFAGGQVSGSGPIRVGERGPETFVPGVPGTILPNGAGGGGQSVSIVVNVDNKGNETTSTDAKNSAAGLGDRLRQAIVEELHNQSRTGGHLYRMKHMGA